MLRQVVDLGAEEDVGEVQEPVLRVPSLPDVQHPEVELQGPVHPAPDLALINI